MSRLQPERRALAHLQPEDGPEGEAVAVAGATAVPGLVSDVCAVEGCTRPVKTRGLCQMHYFRVRRQGAVGEPTSRRTCYDQTDCAVEGCPKPRFSGGLCAMHYARLQRHGDVTTTLTRTPLYGADNPAWTGDQASYTAVHQRLGRERGSARTHTCRCGAPATDWAYQHNDPDERASPYGPYSTNPDCYEPLCGRCHLALDDAHAGGPRNKPFLRGADPRRTAPFRAGYDPRRGRS